MAPTFTINRAPVLTLWAAVVAQRLGHDRDAALTLGRAVAGLNAQSKGRRLGILTPAGPEVVAKRERARTAAGAKTVELLGRQVPVVKTPAGLRAATDGKADSPAAVERYLESKFGEHLAATRAAMTALAKSLPKAELAAHAFALYERFRPAVPEGTRGWGARGVLDLGRLARLAKPTT
jgi:hypothetical protein